MTGANLKDWVLVIAGNIFIVILGVRAVTYYAKKEWGEMVGHLLAGVLVAACVYTPQTVVDLLKLAWTKFNA